MDGLVKMCTNHKTLGSKIKCDFLKFDFLHCFEKIAHVFAYEMSDTCSAFM